MAISSYRGAVKERAAYLGEKMLREWLLESWVPAILAKIHVCLREHFLIQLRQFPPNSRVLRAVTFDTTVRITLQTLLSNLVRFGVERTFETMMHR